MKEETKSADGQSILSSNDGSTSSVGASSLPTLKLDPEEFKAFIEEYDLSEDQSQEYLEILWQIVVTFVDLGFGIDPVQQAMEAGQNRVSITIPAHEINSIMEQTKDTETSERGTST